MRAAQTFDSSSRSTPRESSSTSSTTSTASSSSTGRRPRPAAKRWGSSGPSRSSASPRSHVAVARIAVGATAPSGAEILEELARRHEIAYLLTQPDRPRGRGRKVAPPPAKEAAERLGIPVRQPERLGSEFDPEVETVVTVAYGQLVPRGALERARWLNVHPSLLPRWRGAAPVERSLMAGDEETGVSVIELVEELDA